MPHSILVEHAVGVVHPAIYWRVVIERTEVLAVGCVERVGVFDFLPAHKLTQGSLLPAVAVELYVQQAGALQLIGHVIVHTVDGQLHIDALHHLIPCVEYGNGRNVFGLLYGQQHVLLVLGYSQHGVLLAQQHRRHLRPQRGERHRRNDCQQ